MQRKKDNKQKEGGVEASAFLTLLLLLLLRETSFFGSEIFGVLLAMPEILQSNTH